VASSQIRTHVIRQGLNLRIDCRIERLDRPWHRIPPFRALYRFCYERRKAKRCGDKLAAGPGERRDSGHAAQEPAWPERTAASDRTGPSDPGTPRPADVRV